MIFQDREREFIQFEDVTGMSKVCTMLAPSTLIKCVMTGPGAAD
jgi:hypothetical protein